MNEDKIMSYDLQAAVTVITGGTQGLGLVQAKAFFKSRG